LMAMGLVYFWATSERRYENEMVRDPDGRWLGWDRLPVHARADAL
jgi:hypothetical protein